MLKCDLRHRKSDRTIVEMFDYVDTQIPIRPVCGEPIVRCSDISLLHVSPRAPIEMTWGITA
jgi:hypothetical protein